MIYPYSNATRSNINAMLSGTPADENEYEVT
jgi:hypothetical protein